jgi:hypothetical protein
LNLIAQVRGATIDQKFEGAVNTCILNPLIAEYELISWKRRMKRSDTAPL